MFSDVLFSIFGAIRAVFLFGVRNGLSFFHSFLVEADVESIKFLK